MASAHQQKPMSLTVTLFSLQSTGMFHLCRCGSAIFVLTQVLDACFFGRGGGGGVGEVLKNVLYREALPRRPTPYLLYTTENRIKSQ